MQAASLVCYQHFTVDPLRPGSRMTPNTRTIALEVQTGYCFVYFNVIQNNTSGPICLPAPDSYGQEEASVEEERVHTLMICRIYAFHCRCCGLAESNLSDEAVTRVSELFMEKITPMLDENTAHLRESSWQGKSRSSLQSDSEGQKRLHDFEADLIVQKEVIWFGTFFPSLHQTAYVRKRRLRKEVTCD